MKQCQLLLRTGLTVRQLAERLAEVTGARLSRDLHRRFIVHPWPGRSASQQFVASGAVTWLTGGEPESFLAGWDAEWWVESSVATEGSLPEDLVELPAVIGKLLGVPAALLDDDVVVSAWSPERGLGRFPPETTWDPEDRQRWGPWAPPPLSLDELPPRGEDDPLEQLYRAILADRDSSDLRLRYADVVAGEHPGYAEMIRLQVADTEHRAAGTQPDPVARARLVALEQALVPELLPFSVNAANTYQVRRGFVETIAAGPRRVLERNVGLMDDHPVRAVFLEAEPGWPEQETLASSELMETAVTQPRFRHLVGLSVQGNPIGDAGLARLAAGEHLQRLRWLNVEGTGVTAAGIEALAASGQLPNLQHVVADRDLGLVPEPGYDYDGSLVYVGPAPLRERLAARYDRAWLRRRLVFGRQGEGGPPWYYDEV